VPFTLVHARKYRTEDKNRHTTKLNTTQKKANKAKLGAYTAEQK